MAKVGHFYLGRAGEWVVMAELTLRGYIVATPNIDTGEDILVVHPTKHELSAVQVKASIGKPRRLRSNEKHYQIFVYINQHVVPSAVRLFYAFLLRYDGDWIRVIIPEDELRALVQEHRVGTAKQSDKRRAISVWVTETREVFTYSGTGDPGRRKRASTRLTLTKYIDNFKPWPSLTGYE